MASGDDESVLIKWKNLSEDFRSIIISTKKQYYYDGISFEIMCDDIDFLGDNENNAIRLLSGASPIIKNIILPNTDISRKLVIIKKISAISSKYPRKAGIPSKNPL